MDFESPKLIERRFIITEITGIGHCVRQSARCGVCLVLVF